MLAMGTHWQKINIGSSDELGAEQNITSAHDEAYMVNWPQSVNSRRDVGGELSLCLRQVIIAVPSTNVATLDG